jgi:5'-3' exonuclease
MPTVYLVDASPYIFRAYFSIPATVTAPDDSPTNAILGFTEFWIQLLQKQNPTHLIAAFDGSLTTSFRNEIYPQYKANRARPPEELAAQQSKCLEVTEAMGIRAFIDDKLEADDIIGTLATQLVAEDHRVVVVSSDKDLAQLVSDRVQFWDFAKDVWYDGDAVKEKFGVAPAQMTDYLALTGDSVDNIPGVPGIGKQTAVKLLGRFSGLDEIYANLEAVPALAIRGANGIRDKLMMHEQTAYLSKELATIVTEAPLTVDLEQAEYRGANPDRIDPLFEQLGFERIRTRVPESFV